MAELEDIIIGVDLGGTNVRAGAVTSNGALLFSQDAPIRAEDGPQAGVRRIGDLIESVIAQLPQGQRPSAVGIGSTGPLDRRTGAIQNPHTLPGWEDVSVVRPLEARFGVPVALENDADAAALGEAWAGAGRAVRRMVMVTVGTGVGTGITLDGHIYRGLNDEHPEGGHLVVDPAGPPCYCGGRGCLESLVAGPAIARHAAQEAGLRNSALWALCAGQPENLTAGHVFEAARMGDALGAQLTRRAARYLGLGLVSLVMTFLPDAIVLTGGVMRSFDLLEDDLRAVLRQHSIIVPAERVQLRMAELGQWAGVIGAARAAQLLTSG